MDVRDACESLRKNKEDRGEALLRIVEAIVNEGYEVKLPKVGRWLPQRHGEYVCSECGYTFIADDIEGDNYCSYCGAYNAQEDVYEE
jgi:rubrerythrin